MILAEIITKTIYVSSASHTGFFLRLSLEACKQGT